MDRDRLKSRLERIEKLREPILAAGDEAQTLRRLPNAIVERLVGEGFFRFEQVPTGDISLRALRQSSFEQADASAFLDEGETTDVVLIFPGAGGTVVGVVRDRIRVLQGDTDTVPFGRGTVASRSMINGGNALHAAAEKVIEKGRRIAGHLMEVAADDIVFEAGSFTVAGTDRSIAISEVAAVSFRPVLPPELGLGLSGQGDFLLQGFTFPSGCQIAEVEVDPETGKTEILSLCSVDDVGTVINPMLLDGQIVGGMAQGIGQAVMEDVAYDPDSGQLLTGSFLDYAMPRADDMPAITFETLSTPTATNPIGVKGAGETGTVGATPAVISAIIDALAPLGVTHVDLPATPAAVWAAIRPKPTFSTCSS